MQRKGFNYMRKLFSILLVCCFVALNAQQLPDPHFENWSEKFNGDKQLKDWHGSNVAQFGFKFTFMFQKPGRTGYCAYVADRTIGAFGIKEVGPGYFGLGTAWQFMNGLSTKTATAGTYGGIEWKHRPDTMAVWVKRTGEHTDKEDFHLLYYAWTGTAKGSHYKSKNGGCTEVERINEESDIRQALDGNECTTVESAKQVAEGWYRARAKYNEWTLIKVPIFYMNNAQPSMCNVIFSAGNYPAFRANDGLYDGNALYVDDVELIYSSKIDKMVINGQEWKAFDPNKTEQTYVVSGDKVTVEGYRGVGSLTNIKGKRVQFRGRKLGAQEMTIVPGVINGQPWVITVKAEDGSSTTTYRIKITKSACCSNHFIVSIGCFWVRCVLCSWGK